MKKILFISHDATRTGGPKSLLNFLKWLSNLHQKFDVLLVKGGELTGEFEKLNYERLLNFESIQKTEKETPNKLFKIFSGKDNAREAFQKYEIIYANTVVSLPAAIGVKENSPGCKIICHIHELEMGIIKYAGEESFIKNISHVDYFIAVSKAVKMHLVSKYKISPEKVEIFHGSVETFNYDSDKIQLLNELNIPDKNNYFICTNIGPAIWTKSPDIFIQIADRFNKIYTGKFLFLWIGNWDEIAGKQMEYDIRRLDLTDKVKIFGVRKDIQNFYAISDVFLLTSREDSYPLVCLEAASYGVPVICFKDAGGAPEFVEDDAGFIVPYLDVYMAAEKLKYLALNPGIKKKMGEVAKQKAGKHEINFAGKKILDFLEKI